MIIFLGSSYMDLWKKHDIEEASMMWKSTSRGSLWPPGRRSAAWTPASCYRYRWKDLDLLMQWSWSPQGGRLKKLCFLTIIFFLSFWMIESRNDGRGGFFGYDNISISLYTYTHTHRHLLWRIWWAAWHSRQHQSWAGNIASHPRRHLTCENE